MGIARGLVYRQFSSKEELFVLTVTDYLDELAGDLVDAIGDEAEPVAEQLERGRRGLRAASASATPRSSTARSR